jgi:hypothetical protein
VFGAAAGWGIACFLGKPEQESSYLHRCSYGSPSPTVSQLFRSRRSSLVGSPKPPHHRGGFFVCPKPTTIDVGTAYNDLGATITGPQQDLNLGIEAIVDGGATTLDQITIDTTQPGTHTIEYVATDQDGLETTATRTVIVQAQSPVDASTAEDGTVTSTP